MTRQRRTHDRSRTLPPRLLSPKTIQWERLVPLIGQAKADAILKLHQHMTHRVAEATHSQYAGRAVEFLFSHPVFSTSHFLQDSGIPQKTAHRILRVLRGNDARVLRTIQKGSGRRAAIFAFAQLLNIAEGQTLL